MSNDRYILDGHKPVPCPDLSKWGLMFNDVEARRVAKTIIDHGVYVSTVFLGLDHNFSDSGPPLLFETMVFGGNDFDELDCEQYSTWEEAEAGHKEMVDKVKLAKDE